MKSKIQRLQPSHYKSWEFCGHYQLVKTKYFIWPMLQINKKKFEKLNIGYFHHNYQDKNLVVTWNQFKLNKLFNIYITKIFLPNLWWCLWRREFLWLRRRSTTSFDRWLPGRESRESRFERSRKQCLPKN